MIVQQLASHGLFDVHVKATGDLHIDDHHTNEDVALAIGTVLPSYVKSFFSVFLLLSSTSQMVFETQTCFITVLLKD